MPLRCVFALFVLAMFLIALTVDFPDREPEPQKCWQAHVGNSWKQVEWVWCEPGGLTHVRVGDG